MSDDARRHGTYLGYCDGCREDCCRPAMNTYRKRWELDRLEGRPRVISALGTQRRLQALAALGWPYATVVRRCGIRQAHVTRILTGSSVRVGTAARIATVYDAICMQAPPQSTRAERQASARAKLRAQRNGWSPPLAWDDIDDPAESPARAVPVQSGLDEVVVLRLLDGDPVPATRIERDEAMRRWLTAGRPEKALCDSLGWKTGRYGKAVAS